MRRIERDDAETRVVVEDEGPGIPEEELERVFEPFVRLEASRSRDNRRQADWGSPFREASCAADGGDIRLENRAGGGLRATIALPEAGQA